MKHYTGISWKKPQRIEFLSLFSLAPFIASCFSSCLDVWPLDDFQRLLGSDLWLRLPLMMEGSKEEYQHLSLLTESEIQQMEEEHDISGVCQ